MPMEADPTTADGNGDWGRQLLAEGRLADAAHAFETAKKLDPLNPERYFDLAEVIVRIADEESPYFRDKLWAQAQAVVERGGQLDRQSPRGVALYERILQARIDDRALTEPAPEPERPPRFWRRGRPRTGQPSADGDPKAQER